MVLASPIHAMDDDKWFHFFRTCAETLDVKTAFPTMEPLEGGSWCSWTTFCRLEDVAGYWSGPLPTRDELRGTYLGEGANWSQYFHYSQLCHVVVPHTFGWQRAAPGQFERGNITQDIDAVAEALRTLGIPHRLTSLVLEIKLY
jgi:hypothetical protein